MSSRWLNLSSASIYSLSCVSLTLKRDTENHLTFLSATEAVLRSPAECLFLTTCEIIATPTWKNCLNHFSASGFVYFPIFTIFVKIFFSADLQHIPCNRGNWGSSPASCMSLP